MSSAVKEPLFLNTADNQGAPPVVLGYIGASITVLVTAIRLFLTIHKKHPFRSDDYFFLTGAALAVIASITLERAVDSGLGQHADVLSSSQLNAFTKFTYATALLGVFSQSAAKVSVTFLFERIAPRQDTRGITYLLSAIVLWIVFAVLATAFSCQGRVHWGASCGGGGWLAFPVLVGDLITDAMLSFWMVPRIWKLQASMENRIIPILLMSSRVLVCFAEIGQIAYLGTLRTHSPFNGPDDSWTSVKTWTISICVIHLSITTATIPRINSFIADIQTRKAGLVFSDRDRELYGSGGDSKNRSNNNSKNHPSAHHSRNGYSRNRSPAAVLQSFTEGFRPDHSQQVLQTTKVSSNGRHMASGSEEGDAIEMLDIRDGVETSSQSSLRGNAVYSKTEFTWEEEYTHDGPRESSNRHR